MRSFQPAMVAIALVAVSMPGMAVALVQNDQDLARCTKPELRDSPRVSKEQLAHTGELMQAYVKCVGPILEERRKHAQALLDQGRAEAEANNAQVKEVNALVEAYRRYEAEHADDEN